MALLLCYYKSSALKNEFSMAVYVIFIGVCLIKSSDVASKCMHYRYVDNLTQDGSASLAPLGVSTVERADHNGVALLPGQNVQQSRTPDGSQEALQ